MLPLSTFVALSWNVVPHKLIRYHGYPAIRITGSPPQEKLLGSAGRIVTTGIRRWAGNPVHEKESASQPPGLIVHSVLLVFGVLAALY
ncbi:hypothetical protein [Rosenbergiella collisarenosi]|uniref:hypothetical protein n=1 Tax=Rosenbergiella collisarenosi TaxID=1544695 RepID=UPI00240D9363|nr:hypothetical protein [Rosenbergiella collisarenosi]